MADEPEGDRLYGLPLEEFTEARDAVAAHLRSAGDAEEATRVKALRKPTTPAWAVNQLVRRQRPLIEELISASDRLRRAQQELLQGGSAQQVWEVTLQERDVLARLGHEAARVLEGRGYGATRATLDRISDTLAAAAADPRGRTLLRRGILTTEMRRAGFGDILEATGEDAEPPPRPARAASRKQPIPKTGKAAGPTPRHLLDAEREAARLAREAATAEGDAERYERAAAKSQEEVAAAKKRLQGAERSSAQARAEASAARKEALAARREAERASARLEKLRASRRG